MRSSAGKVAEPTGRFWKDLVGSLGAVASEWLCLIRSLSSDAAGKLGWGVTRYVVQWVAS